MTNPKSLDFIEGGETYRAVQIFGEGSDGLPALINVSGGGIRAASSTGTLASTTVAVAGLTTIGAAIDTSNMTQMFVQIDNTDASAVLFDAFEIQASPDGGVTFKRRAWLSAHYTSPRGTLIESDADMTTLAAAATGCFTINVEGVDQVRFQASANTTQSEGVTGKWSAN
ncbi:MAG: hypothetical protein KAJ19_14855 [Gammaproteobacteria bacterium]|nr:hypothetical protein [Gammaproteobacteria bacterium]